LWNQSDGLDFSKLDSLQTWDALCKSLASPDCQLKRLKIHDFDSERYNADHDEASVASALTKSLCYGLSRNESLVELDIGFAAMTRNNFLRILQCIEHHKTLRAISLWAPDEWSEGFDPKLFTRAWGEILKRNQTILFVRFDEDLYNERIFERHVIPHLIRNEYFMLIGRSQQMKDSLSRAFFVGNWIQEAVEEHASPPITYMLIRMNADIISIYLDEKYRRRG
jgi:hypothetical protein